jgi:hypothetical protein
MLNNFGGFASFRMRNEFVANVGTFACKGEIAEDLLFTMYMMCKDVGHTDQPVFNILTSLLLKDKCIRVDYTDAWAFQIGAIVDRYQNYCDVIPTVNPAGDFDNPLRTMPRITLVPLNSVNPYCIIHQYDRIPELKKEIDLAMMNKNTIMSASSEINNVAVA